MDHTLTIQGECFLPAILLRHLREPAQVEAWLRATGLLPPSVQGCRWRSAPERDGYVVAYEITVTLAEAPGQ